jgi:hypothetical protein
MLSSRPQSLLKRFWLTTLRPATAVPAILPMAQQAQQASTSGRTAVRVPGPVETSMQQKVGHERMSEEVGEREHGPGGFGVRHERPGRCALGRGCFALGPPPCTCSSFVYRSPWSPLVPDHASPYSRVHVRCAQWGSSEDCPIGARLSGTCLPAGSCHPEPSVVATPSWLPGAPSWSVSSATCTRSVIWDATFPHSDVPSGRSCLTSLRGRSVVSSRRSH